MVEDSSEDDFGDCLDEEHSEDTEVASLATEMRLRDERLKAALAEIRREQVSVDKAKKDLGTEWMKEAKCADLVSHGFDPDAWFDAPIDTWEAYTATEACFECPVRLECLKWSIDAKERFGIWGGMSATARTTKRKVNQVWDYDALAELPNPYLTEDKSSPYYRKRLRLWVKGEEDN